MLPLPVVLRLQGPRQPKRNARWEPRAAPSACTSRIPQHLAHFLPSLLGTREATGYGGSELRQPTAWGADERQSEESPQSPAVKEPTRSSSQVLGGAPTRPSHLRDGTGRESALKACLLLLLLLQVPLRPLSTHSLTPKDSPKPVSGLWSSTPPALARFGSLRVSEQAGALVPAEGEGRRSTTRRC